DNCGRKSRNQDSIVLLIGMKMAHIYGNHLCKSLETNLEQLLLDRVVSGNGVWGVSGLQRPFQSCSRRLERLHQLRPPVMDLLQSLPEQPCSLGLSLQGYALAVSVQGSGQLLDALSFQVVGTGPHKNCLVIREPFRRAVFWGAAHPGSRCGQGKPVQVTTFMSFRCYRHTKPTDQ
uniref:Uncharacterized protein n=1 Tax=Oryzias sinensis TaxID=183150 RepID=A0A8C8DYP2_9TELE